MRVYFRERDDRYHRDRRCSELRVDLLPVSHLDITTRTQARALDAERRACPSCVMGAVHDER